MNEKEKGAAYDAQERKDGRFDGQFYIAVKTTGICRPSVSAARKISNCWILPVSASPWLSRASAANRTGASAVFAEVGSAHVVGLNCLSVFSRRQDDDHDRRRMGTMSTGY